jgi:hypothetical protein
MILKQTQGRGRFNVICVLLPQGKQFLWRPSVLALFNLHTLQPVVPPEEAWGPETCYNFL